jgi:PilZ domain
MQDRIARRIHISVRLAFVGLYKDLDGEAQTVDLSFSGCRAMCQGPPPPKGTKLQISLYLTGMDQTVSIEVATIRWVRKSLIGIAFHSIPPSHREELLAWIMNAPYGRSVMRSRAAGVLR